MATRADRLNERLRGAQRTNLDDDDTFGLDIPGLGNAPLVPEQPAPPAETTRATPGSAKRQRADRSRSRSSQDGSSGRNSTRSRPQTASSLANVPEERSSPLATAASTRPRRISAAPTSSPAAPREDDPEDELEALPAPRSSKSPASGRLSSRATFDEVEESPQNAPGSGRRRIRDTGGASASSVRLQDVLGSDEPADSSSPLARVAKRKSVGSALPGSQARAFARGSSLRQETRPDDEDELSPDRVKDTAPDQEAAKGIGAAEAAKVLGRKRPRRSTSRQSPDLGSGSPEAEEEAEEVEQPAAKRQKGRQPKSPATQKQPAPAKAKAARRTSQETAKRATKAKAAPAAKTSKAVPPKQRKRRSNAAPANDGDEDEAAADDDAAIEITVQRFVNHKKRGGGEDDDDEDPLHSEIPFANRTGESTIDVFAQVCEEVINNTMGQFHELLSGATADAAKKKEFRIKMRAIDAYKEELNSRLLQHAIHLDHWFSLRKRVRHVQKEKLTLRDDILKLKAEREQVALRMDAIRTKHEVDTKESTYRLDASAIMHDIDLAVERGQKAPELTRAEQKEADLSNLELLVAQVTDQASSKSTSGGLLQQVTDFNAFLERAALALETR